MSISFSGLASGLDTSSWVESLVALKKAKVETYEEEKSKIQTTQETLSKIKSFFTSFRSMLEKVTDAKFGVGSMDIFAQKLATSSDTSILTAAATTEAEEASYEINVDKLATGTQAVSGFKNMTTVIQSETATMNTKLSAIGVKAGDIGVTVNGTKHTVTIGENDTISNFITKMKNIGVDANYSETSGIFSINLPSGAIDDTLTKHADGTVGTGIVDALHLKSTGGYESSDLKITNSETIVTSATGNTKLSELGTIKSGDIQVKANGTSYTFAINDNTTLANLINNLQSFGVDANLSSDGVLQIRDAEIVDVGNTGIISALGLTSNVNSKSQTSGSLNYETVVTTVTDANGSTKLQELDGWSAVGSDTQIVAKSSSGTTTTINVSGTNTIDEVVTKLNNAGLSASFNTKGVLTVSEGTVSGKVADVLGVTSGSGNTQKIYMSGNILSTKTVTYATAYDTLKDLGISTAKPSSGYALAVYDSKNTLVQEITVNDSMTIDDIFTELSKYGVIGSMSDGVITLNSSNGNFVRGSVAEGLGISVFTSVMMTGSVGGNYSITTPIDATCTFAKAGVKASGRSLTVFSSSTVTDDGTIVGKDPKGIITITSISQTFQDLFDALAAYGITAEIYDGYIQLNSGSDYFVQGDLADILGIDVSNVQKKYYTPVDIRYSLTIDNVTGDTTLNYLCGLDSEETIVTTNMQGVSQTIKVDGTTSVSELFKALGGSGYVGHVSSISYNAVRSDDRYCRVDYISENLQKMLTSSDINIEREKSVTVNTVSDRFVYVTNGSTEDTSSYQTIYSNKTTGTLMSTGIGAAADDTQLGAIKKSDGTSITFASEGTAALIIKTTDKDGIVRNNTINFSKTQTLKSVFDTLASYGINATVDGAGMVSASSTELSDFDISGALGEFLLGSNYTKKYDTKSEGLKTKDITTQTVGATRDTLLSDLGVTAGEFYIYNNGVKYTALISSEDTLGSFMDTLKSFGIQAGLIDKGDSSSLVLIGSGNSYVAKSNNVNNASNVVEKLFGTSDVSVSYSYTGSELLYSTVTHTTTATTDSLLSDFDTPWGGSILKSAGDLVVMVNGEIKTVRITDTETFGSLVDKLKNAGIQADFLNGKLYISNTGDLSIIAERTTSSLFNPNANLKMTSKDVLSGFMSSTATVQSTTTIIEEHSASASAYADMNTKLSTLGITSGSLSIYRNGEKALINIEASHTLGNVRSLISQKFSNVDMKFDDNGKLVFYSTDKDVSVELGNTTDTSNFLAVTGVTKTKDGTAESARVLYTVNGESKVMADGIFRRGKVTAGSFIIGTERIEINANTTINDLVATINNAEGANATAYWDTIDGKLVIKSRSSGAALINIEAGTSNFTDIMGYTTSEWNADGSLKVSRMNIDTQELGSNAQFRINGTSYTATSNTITSDITRIKGVTLNLNGLTSGSSIKVTVEKDKESVASALSDIVDSYNELMSNVDDAIAKDGALKNQTTLKMIRNQLRSLMTSSDLGATTFRNLSAIGISVEAASASNISTSNSSIINLNFDKEAFFKAYEADADAVKALLIGGKDNKGIFTNVETIVENALQSVSGYFAVTESAYNRELTNLNSKITKSNKEIDRYKSRLEKKFSSMDLTISQMQQQYSSFLS